MIPLGMRAMGWSLHGLALAAILAISTAAAGERINKDADDLAILGYDTVAYFTDERPVKGSPDFEYVWQDARWQFASAEHRTLFAATPTATPRSLAVSARVPWAWPPVPDRSQRPGSSSTAGSTSTTTRRLGTRPRPTRKPTSLPPRRVGKRWARSPDATTIDAPGCSPVLVGSREAKGRLIKPTPASIEAGSQTPSCTEKRLRSAFSPHSLGEGMWRMC